MKNKLMKQKAIHAEYRKTSETFPEWLKYEVTLLNEDGTTSKVPAYGKDLQDALSRVVHDSKVKKLEKKYIKKLPVTGWVIAWFLGLSLILTNMYSSIGHNYVGVYIVGAIVTYTFMTLSVANWFSLRNLDKK
jgi:hypothetical protein|tara:strand:+ start:2506 stop:2904 length:399 start_codon:yes stop_codon:yes gene_type:complete